MKKRRRPVSVTIWSEEMSGMTSVWGEDVHLIRYTDGRFGLKGDSPWDDSGSTSQYELRYRSPRFNTAEQFMSYLQEAGRSMGIEHLFEPDEIREMLPLMEPIAPDLADDVARLLPQEDEDSEE